MSPLPAAVSDGALPALLPEGQIPVEGCFVANRGQLREGIAYYAVGNPSFSFSQQGLMLLQREGTEAHAVALRFEGASPVEPQGVGPVCYRSHFLIGARAEWVRDVPAYPALRYENLYDGIDLTYRLAGGLKAEFLVHPGADPAAIHLGYDGADLALDGAGNLLLRTPVGDVVDAAPFAYQDASNLPAPVATRYSLADDGLRFELGSYDVSRPLILDPLIYATYAGGFEADRVEGIAVDAAGHAYVVGTAFSADFPTTAGVYDPSGNGQEDVFVAKLNPGGTGLVYATFLGGSSWDFGHGLAVDASGNAFVVGATSSPDFPTTAGAYATDRGGCCDAYVAKLNAEGSDLLYATYLGGTAGEAIWSVVVDDAGTAYVVGDTSSSNFPATEGADDTTPNGSRDAFVARLSTDGTELVWATFLGGEGFELGYGIALDPSGGVYVTGLTGSFAFPTTSGAYDRGYNGGDDGFLARYDVQGVRLYSSYLGGANDDRGRQVAVDPLGFVYVTGPTSSGNFPVTPGAYDTSYNGGGGDVFVTKLYPGGRGALYSTFLGGTNEDRGWSIAVDAAGIAYVTGWTLSPDFPTTSGAVDERFNGPDPDVYVSQLSPQGTTLLYSTFLGGRGWDQGWSIALDQLGATYVGGETDSTAFPATVGAFDESANGLEDALVLKLVIPRQTLILDLISPWNYGAIPAGTEVRLAVAGLGVQTVSYALDDGPFTPLAPPYTVGTGSWTVGTHVLHARVEAEDGATVARSFVIFVDANAAWPPDTVSIDVVLVGFDLSPGFLETQLRSSYTVPAALRPGATSLEIFNLQYDFRVQAASAAYHQALVDHLQTSATFRDALQARLNITALVDQRNTGTARDIFNPLVGWEIPTEAAEAYLEQNPPVPLASGPGYTFYVLNLSAFDDASAGVDHWFVEPTLDPDTGRAQDWWRLEWDNALNTPMGYPLNTWGGPAHRVYVDPTAYQWYLDWAHVWWENRNVRAPYGLQFEEVPTTERAAYLSGFLNDLVEGLGAELPQGPPVESAVLIRNYVLSGSLDLALDDLAWTVSSGALESYLQGFLPFKAWEVNTTFALIEDFPALQAVVDANTEFVGDQGFIDARSVFTYLLENKDAFLLDDPSVFEILTVNFLYDNRSMVVGGREFTGLGGAGITAIFLKTDRLFDGGGTAQKGLTSIISHETGHNLGYLHQFGPQWRADFVEGNMGYFRNDLTYGAFWEDALYRVYVREKLRTIQALLEEREPLDLGPEFLLFYSDYRAQDFLAALEDLVRLEAMLTDAVPPVAVLGPALTVEEDRAVVLDAAASSDNFRILTYAWDFGDGTTTTTSQPQVEKTWTTPGLYQVQLTVMDAAGNRDVGIQEVMVLDLTPPFLLILSPDPAVVVDTPDVRVGWQASDEGLGLDRFRLSLDGGPAVVLEGDARSHVFPLVPDGNHFLVMTAFDVSGNEASSSITFQVVTGLLSPTKPYSLILLVAIGSSLTALAVLLVYRNARRGRPK